MKSVRDITELQNKKVLLRVDFNVPIKNKKIGDAFRVEKQKETIDYLANNGARIALVGHSTIEDSFGDIVPQLAEIMGRKIELVESVDGLSSYVNDANTLVLLDNVRKNSGEMSNDMAFASKLSEGFDVYINNDFSVSHRNHASVSAVAELLPAYAGFVVQEEVLQLSKVIGSPMSGKVIVMGGAKASTKIPVIKNFMDKADYILTGGIIANDILKEKGHDTGNSLVDDNLSTLLDGVDLESEKLIVPMDFNIQEGKILDLGPKTIERYKEIISMSKILIWNGPMGLFEDEKFAQGTNSIANAIAKSDALSIVGGGDTIVAIDKLDLLKEFNFVSTGGGAMLTFLAEQNMPGLVALQ